MYHNIPDELKNLRQWVCWRYVQTDTGQWTKIPYAPNYPAYMAAVDQPGSWSSFDEAVQSQGISGFDGIGFVLTDSDPYALIDLDATDDAQARQHQIGIYNAFNSYSERSPSGQGCHIIVKGIVPTGRKRAHVEVYSSLRYMTMTGDVCRPMPIADYAEYLSLLHSQMAPPNSNPDAGTLDMPEEMTDEEVLTRASGAVNKETFLNLWAGNFQLDYPSQSEADQALINILAFYTQNRQQIRRLFRQSALGQRDKAQRDSYLNYTITKAFDRMPSPVDIDKLKVAMAGMLVARATAALDPVQPPSPPMDAEAGNVAVELSSLVPASGPLPPVPSVARASSEPDNTSIFPPGLVGDIAHFIYAQSPRPVAQISLIASLGLMSGIAGRAYNISGTGLNQYLVLLAKTGTGKEAIASGISKLIKATEPFAPTIADFYGPMPASAQGLLKHLSKKSACFVSVYGEMGIMMKSLASSVPNNNMLGIKRAMLDLYNKSGFNQSLQATVYSDNDKNVDAVKSPSFSIIGESVPENWYGALTDDMITDGFLPRFSIVEYTGKRVPNNANSQYAMPTEGLVNKLAMLANNCQQITQANSAVPVGMDAQAAELFLAFDQHADAKINATGASEITANLWNRAHIKALKLAAVIAVGINPYNPVIGVNEAQWSIGFCTDEITNIVAKHQRGETGSKDMESEQLRSMYEGLHTWLHERDALVKTYSGSEAAAADGLVEVSLLKRRLGTRTCFRQAKNGANNAFKASLQVLIDAGVLREVSKQQVFEKYQKTAQFVAIADIKAVENYR